MTTARDHIIAAEREIHGAIDVALQRLQEATGLMPTEIEIDIMLSEPLGVAPWASTGRVRLRF